MDQEYKVVEFVKHAQIVLWRGDEWLQLMVESEGAWDVYSYKLTPGGWELSKDKEDLADLAKATQAYFDSLDKELQ